jgi:hypothetical protein
MTNDAWSKLLVVFACTLAGGREPLSLLSFETGQESATCSSDSDLPPCSEIAKKIEIWHIITPIYIAGSMWLVVAMPTICLRGQHKARGVRSLIFTLMLLWIHLIICYCIFLMKEDIVLAYVWGVHSAAHVLATWRPRRHTLMYQEIQPYASVIGVLLVAEFAREIGAPVGLVPWQSGKQAQCWWIVHFVCVIGVDVLDWPIGPVEAMMQSQ